MEPIPNKLPEDSLDESVDKNWNPPITKRVRLVSIIDDAGIHSAQVVYTHRLIINE